MSCTSNVISGMMVHSQIWPEITMTIDTVQNDMVRLEISGHDVIGSQVMHTGM
jgi:hypothetical protein